MSGLGEQIAVLDGLDAMDPNDGRLGQRRAGVTQYARPKMPGVTFRRNVLDASEGANYSGGSAYAPGLPLGPSSWGLAGLGGIPSVLPQRRNVIDPSGGANYTGGSDWVPGLPLVVSSAGLADDFIRGGYGRAGLGAAFIQGGYGRAGLGETASAADEDLAGAAEAVAAAAALSPQDGRIGQTQAQVDEYGRPVMPGVLARSNVLDASEGANYSGGSAYAPGLPLGPSSWGLAGLEGDMDGLDELSQIALAECQMGALDGVDLGGWFRRRRSSSAAKKAVARVASKISPMKVASAKKRIIKSVKKGQRSRSPKARAKVSMALHAARMRLARLRSQRANFAQRIGLWAR